MVHAILVRQHESSSSLLLVAPAQTLRYRHIASDITALPHYDGDGGRSSQPSSRGWRTVLSTHSQQPPRRLGGESLPSEESLPSGPAATTAPSVGKRGPGPEGARDQSHPESGNQTQSTSSDRSESSGGDQLPSQGEQTGGPSSLAQAGHIKCTPVLPSPPSHLGVRGSN